MANVLIVGCGYVGETLGLMLVADGHRVYAMKREPAGLPDELVPVAADVSRPNGIGALPPQIDQVVYAVGAKVRDEDAYRAAYLDGLGNVLRALGDEGQRPRRIVFTSSTSVYGQSRGEWVDEDSPTHPRGFPGEILLTTERLLHGSPYPSTVIRLGGIYGPGRRSMIDRVLAGTTVPVREAPQYTNRIHRDDAAGAIAHLLALEDPAQTYVGVDNEPADGADVLRFVAGELGKTLEEDRDPPPARVGSKRCSNRRLRESGYTFAYPSYREGYGELISAGGRESA